MQFIPFNQTSFRFSTTVDLNSQRPKNFMKQGDRLHAFKTFRTRRKYGGMQFFKIRMRDCCLVLLKLLQNIRFIHTIFLRINKDIFYNRLIFRIHD